MICHYLVGVMMCLNSDTVEISVIIPLYNESQSIESLFARLTPVFEQLNTSYEVIYINDGSQDDTLAKILEYWRQNAAIKVVNLSRSLST